MRRAFFPLLLAMVLILAGCGSDPASTQPSSVPPTAAPSADPEIQSTVPPDGDPENVTCRGSYQGNLNSAVVATLGGYALTNRDLQVWYWAEVAGYRQEGHEIAPDFSQPLDSQVCTLDPSVNSWQQYFLQRALNAWQNSAALLEHSIQVGLPLESDYKPRQSLHDLYLTDKPAKKFLYGQNAYSPNTMHQAYLDSLPDMLEQLAQDQGYETPELMAQSVFGVTGQTLLSYAEIYNQAYFYFTNLTYYLEEDPEAYALFLEENRDSYPAGKVAEIRHILLVPESETTDDDKKLPADPWERCERQARELLTSWQHTTAHTAATFSEYAQKYSQDLGTALDGGAYRNIRQGQLIDPVDSWCFDESRRSGDTAILRSEMGIHIVYFCQSQEISDAQAREDFTRLQQEALIARIREMYPAQFHYEKMILGSGKAAVSSLDVLYGDVAHERFPEIPLYLQQDYPATRYGYVWLATHGCGITTMAMLASYMADDELTPPEMCARFGRYASEEGTDVTLFFNEPSSMGFYLRESTRDHGVAYAALQEGQIVISLQHKGYWTQGGHYIAMEWLSDDGRVQVRDSNLYNYNTLDAHKEDLHAWGSVTENNFRYWIFEDKVTRIPACCRCGEGETTEGCILTDSYLCHKCTPALTRRAAFQSAIIQ